MSNSVDENSPEYMKCEANKAIDSFYQVLLNTVQGMNRNKPNFNNVQLFNFSTKHRWLLLSENLLFFSRVIAKVIFSENC